MNLSTFITRIKLKLGLMNIATPFENLDDIIMTILKDITIPTFSIYYPVKEKIIINTRDLELLEKEYITEKRELASKDMIKECEKEIEKKK